MEMAQISQTYISIIQMNGLFFIGNVVLLWMMFRGVTNANLYGANTFGKVMHSVISICVVAFNANTYGNVTSAVNNWAYAACLLYTSPSPRDRQKSRMPSSA